MNWLNEYFLHHVLRWTAPMVRIAGIEPALAGWEPAVITPRPYPPGQSECMQVIERDGGPSLPFQMFRIGHLDLAGAGPLELLGEEERDRLVRKLLGDAEIKQVIAAKSVASDG